MTENTNLPCDKSEILFLYESSYSVPNGDPFTSEQRYDDETRKILVSDVRIKRFIRDYLNEQGHLIYVLDPKDSSDKEKTGASARFKQIQGIVQKKSPHLKDPTELLLQCIDARLFGAVVTLKDDKKKKPSDAEEGEGKKDKPFNVTGAVQFALLNPSLNKVDLRMHQNTSVFPSGKGKERGAIGTTTVVPFALCQIHGWINPYSAKQTGLVQKDIDEMFKALWASINNANTRSKSNQNSLLLLQVVYADSNKKLYGMDRLITHAPNDGKQDEQLRSSDDYTLDFSRLKEEIAKSNAVRQVNFYTEHEAIRNELTSAEKFKEMTWQ